MKFVHLGGRSLSLACALSQSASPGGMLDWWLNEPKPSADFLSISKEAGEAPTTAAMLTNQSLASGWATFPLWEHTISHSPFHPAPLWVSSS